MPVVVADAASLFSGKPSGNSPGVFDPGAAKRVLNASGMSDPIDTQIHVVALRRAIERAKLA
jgi:carbon-monoxide dehydrogenase medium subunit